MEDWKGELNITVMTVALVQRFVARRTSFILFRDPHTRIETTILDNFGLVKLIKKISVRDLHDTLIENILV